MARLGSSSHTQGDLGRVAATLWASVSPPVRWGGGGDLGKSRSSAAAQQREDAPKPSCVGAPALEPQPASRSRPGQPRVRGWATAGGLRSPARSGEGGNGLTPESGGLGSPGGLTNMGACGAAGTACAGPAPSPLPAGGAPGSGCEGEARRTRNPQTAGNTGASPTWGNRGLSCVPVGERGNCPKGSSPHSHSLPQGGRGGPRGEGRGSYLTTTPWNQGAPSRARTGPF